MKVTAEHAICESKCESGTPRSGVSISRLASGNRRAAAVSALRELQIQIKGIFHELYFY